MHIDPSSVPTGDHSIWLDIGTFAILMAASAYFGSAETALTGASRPRMAALAKEGDKRADIVNRLREQQDKMIGALLLGSTFVNILASSFATSVLIRIFGDKGVAIAAIGVTAAVFIFAEVMPKTYALMYADKLSLFLARSVSFLMSVFSPITLTVSKIVRFVFKIFKVGSGDSTPEQQEEELRGAIQLFKNTEQQMDQEKSIMLDSILDLADVNVEEIMVHRRNVRMINADWPTAKMIDEVLHSTFSRLPVWTENQDNIIGVLHAKLLLNEIRRCGGSIEKVNISNAMLEPWFIPQSTTLFDQLQAFRKRREHFALMVDEYGDLKGVITLEDILEEIVGQIDDEHDKVVAGVHPQQDGSFIVDGKVTIRDLNREFDWGLPDQEYSTIAGLLLHETQRIPNIGQSFLFYGFRFEIIRRQRNQLTSIRIVPPLSKNAIPTPDLTQHAEK